MAEANMNNQTNERGEQSPAPVFALDIGTRSVVGLVGEAKSDGFHIIDYEQIEHPVRAMSDGQVEDIAAVSSVIAKVKSRLEERLQFPLHNVAVAAAGRALRTVRTRLTRELTENSVIDAAFVLGMESEAIEQAQRSIQNADAPASLRFYFVGYSVMQYSMDDLPVSSLIGHSCSNATVELIAAFLPFSVIESLYASVEECALSVSSLTLEPIAAMNVLIPPELRLLNLALVDIGAGTSDVAVCREGAVCAYEMATIAGDELTEAIIRHCLVPFDTAEALKRALGGGEETLSYEDVLGMSCEMKRQELLSILEPSIDLLAKTIAEKILACNGEVPAAVFIIGGGSQIPGLGERLSYHLKLDVNKISAGRTRALRGVISDFPALNSPEFVTPIGIALTSVKQQSFQFWGVTVNGKPLKLLITREIRMIDLLLMAGYQSSQILGRTGRNLLFYLDGEQQLIKGGLPEHASLRCNGKEASVDTLIYPGDHIEFVPAQNGKDAALRLEDITAQEDLGVLRLCGKRCRIGAWAELNGKYAPGDTQIQPQDRIVTRSAHTFGELCRSFELDAEQLFCEETPLSEDTPLREGMRIILRPGETAPVFPPEFTEAEASPVVDTLIQPSAADAPFPAATAAEAPVPAPASLEVQVETPVEAASEAPVETAAEAPVEAAAEETTEAPLEASGESPAEAPLYDFGGGEEELYGEEDEDEGFPPIPLQPSVSAPVQTGTLAITLNGKPFSLPLDGEHPHYYMMNLLGLCGLDLKNPQGAIHMRVNGQSASFSHMIEDCDSVEIGWK